VIAGSVYIAYRTGAIKATIGGVKSLSKKIGAKLTEKQLIDVVTDACKTTTIDIEKSIPEIVSKLESSGDKYLLKAGSTMHHITGNKDFDITKSVSDRLFTSFSDDDVAAYKSLLNIRSSSNINERYDVKLKAIKDLVIPNEERTNQIVNELLNKQEFKNKLINTMTNFKMSSLGYSNPHSKSKVYKALYKMHRQRQLESFNEMTSNEKINLALWSVVRNDVSSTDVKNAFKQKGFNAFFDGNDRGKIAYSPLVILDPKSSLTSVSKEIVMNKDIVNAANQILNNHDHPAYKDAKDLLKKIVVYGGNLSRI